MKKRFFSFFMCMVIILGMIPITAQAEAILKYVNSTDLENEYEFSVSQGDATVAVFVDGLDNGASYTLEEDVSESILLIHNVAIALGEGAGIGEFRIAGSGSLNLGDRIITAGNMTDSVDDTNNANEVFAFFTSEAYEGTPDTPPDVAYSYDVIQDCTITEYLNAHNLTVAEQIKLNLNSYVEALNVTVSGEIYIGQSENPEEPNGLNIKDNGSLTVTTGGSITAAEGQILEIHSGSTVDGITLYDIDGETSFSDFSHTEVFQYSTESDGRWVRIDPNGNGDDWQTIPENNFVVRFDPNNEAKVEVNETPVAESQNNEFTQGNTLTFTLTPPTHLSEAEPIVEIIVFGEPWIIYQSDLQAGFEDEYLHKLDLNNNTFTFTPESASPFEVNIWWSEYDRFGGTEEKPVIIEIDQRGNGFVRINNVNEEDVISFESWLKTRVSEDTDSITLSWDSDSIPFEIRVERGNPEAEDGWLVFRTEDFTENYCSIPLTQQEGNGSAKRFYYIQVQFDEEGNRDDGYDFKRLQEELNGSYFAFGDINDDGRADSDDLKYGVMRTLYDGFRVNEGRYQREGAALGLREDFNKQDPTNLNANMEKLLALTTVNPTPIEGDSITAIDKSGATHIFSSYQIQIKIDALYEGREQEEDLSEFPDAQNATVLEEPIILTAKAYLLDMENSSEQVIIKVEDTYFVRDAYSEPGGNNSDLERFEGLNAWALILVADYENKENITLFGNYAHATEEFSDETSKHYYASGFGTNDGVKYLGDKFIVYDQSFLGVTINGTGETKEPLAWSVTSSLSVAETGVNTETDLYFGYDSVEIEPITSDKVQGIGAQEIVAVEVLDNIPENAVKIQEPDANGSYVVQFLSDYYDTVRIKVTYKLDDNSTDSGIMTINRVGILIQGGRTAGDSHTVNIFHGHDMGETLDADVYERYQAENTDKQHGDFGFAYYATYYYPTSTEPESADTSLFVTYTYEDGTVERKLLESDYFTPATPENVAMSDYILYMGDGTNAPIKVEAIAVANANDDGTISGAKLGAGKGVEKIFSFEE